MHVDLHVNKPFCVKRGLNSCAKNIGPHQPVDCGNNRQR